MRHIMVRGDDLGYSEGINYGLAKSVRDGIVNNVGLMVNMPASEHGFALMDGEAVCVGMHSNICAGRPVLPPEQIPSLVQESGDFRSSREYRSAGNDLVVLDDAILELEAQYHRFLAIAGREPEYIDVHALGSANFQLAAETVASRHGIVFSGLTFDGSPVKFGAQKAYIWMESSRADYDPEETFLRMAAHAHEDACDILVYHPGYLDQTILRMSSLTIARTKEVEAACGAYLKEYIRREKIHLWTYRELREWSAART